MGATDADDQELSPQIQKLAADFQLVDGEILLYEEDFEAWRETMGSSPPGERRALCLDLIALGLKFQREGGEDAENGTRQLMELAAALLASEQDAEALFAAVGLDTPAHAKVTGAEQMSKEPATSGGPAGAGSVFAMRIGRKDGDKS